MVESGPFFSRLLFLTLFQLGYRYIPLAGRQIGIRFCLLSPISQFADFALEGVTLAGRKVRILMGRLGLPLSFLEPNLERLTLIPDELLVSYGKPWPSVPLLVSKAPAWSDPFGLQQRGARVPLNRVTPRLSSAVRYSSSAS